VLKEARNRLGISQEEVSIRAGCSVSYYGVVERWQRIPSRETFARILEVLRVSGGTRHRAEGILQREHIKQRLRAYGAELQVAQDQQGEPTPLLQESIPVYHSQDPDLRFDATGTPGGTVRRQIGRTAHNTDPRAYAIKVVGNDYYPCLWHRDIIEFAPGDEVRSGDIGLAAKSTDHAWWIRVIRFSSRRHNVRLEPLNPTESVLHFPIAEITLHHAISIRRQGMYR
jgi:transcriptional regulator with XRE-family HTH domain